MKSSQIAAQLYSFRDFIRTPEGVEDTLERLHAIGYEAVQLSSSLAPMAPEQLAALLDRYSLTPCSAHENGADILEKTSGIIEKLKKLHCSHLAYPGPHVNITGRGEAVAFAQALNAKAGEFASCGITLAYHNHHVEFKRFGKETLLELIYANAPQLEGEIDTYWVQKGGADPVRWIEQLSGRQQVLHLKDYGMKPFCDCGGSVMMPVGEGNLDWKRILDAADRAGVTCWVVEHDGDTSDPFGSFASSIRFLKEKFSR